MFQRKIGIWGVILLLTEKVVLKKENFVMCVYLDQVSEQFSPVINNIYLLWDDTPLLSE